MIEKLKQYQQESGKSWYSYKKEIKRRGAMGKIY